MTTDAGRARVRAAIWTRRVKKWRRWSAEMLADGGLQVIEPEDFETPPEQRAALQEARRIANTS